VEGGSRDRPHRDARRTRADSHHRLGAGSLPSRQPVQHLERRHRRGTAPSDGRRTKERRDIARYPKVPSHHKHVHNTALQITLESGYLGLVTFLWRMGRFGALSWRLQRGLRAASGAPHALAVAISRASWGFHVAGLVEYTFGDNEVLEIFFVIMGLGLALERTTPHSG
jgi:hypothetical protein